MKPRLTGMFSREAHSNIKCDLTRFPSNYKKTTQLTITYLLNADKLKHGASFRDTGLPLYPWNQGTSIHQDDKISSIRSSVTFDSFG